MDNTELRTDCLQMAIRLMGDRQVSSSHIVSIAEEFLKFAKPDGVRTRNEVRAEHGVPLVASELPPLIVELKADVSDFIKTLKKLLAAFEDPDDGSGVPAKV